MDRSRRWWILFLFLSVCRVPAEAETVRVYAATSLTNALQEIEKGYSEGTGIVVRFSFAGSSTLARQIEQGAPADVYLSANPAWMDYLEDRGYLEEGTRRDLLGNSLVVVAPKGEGFEMAPRRGTDLAGRFEGRLAMANPSHVPAGMYAAQALRWLGWWEGVKDRLALGQDVRTALAYVERGACPAGVVYATDAAVSSRVEVVARLPATACDPIVYAGAILRGQGRTPVRRLVEYLRSDAATEVFQRYGFRVLR